jgi:hypothetical protein
MYRHGDVFIATGEISKGAKQLPHCVLAEGEVTGHRHEIEEPSTADLLQFRGKLFLRVTAKQATLVHQEHKPIALPKGDYRIWIQREYEPKAPRGFRNVSD